MTWVLLFQIILLVSVFAVLFSWVRNKWLMKGVAARCVEYEFKLKKEQEFRDR